MNEIDILKKLVSIDTVKDKGNREIMDFLESFLRKEGFILEKRTKNLIMRNKEECALGFLGHTDTVAAGTDWTTAPLNLREDGDFLYGLGVSDMKGGIAAILAAVQEIDWNKMKKGIKLFFTYDEEIGFSGIKELIETDEKFPEYMLIGEPTDNRLMNGSKGLLESRVYFKGRAAHASSPDKGDNAIEKLLRFISAVQNFYRKLIGDGDMSEKSNYTTMNLGKIEGGSGFSIVPNYAAIYLDFRPISRADADAIVGFIEREAQKENGVVEKINDISPFIAEEDKSNMTDFISEASFIPVRRKYILGCGPITAHEKDEHISKAKLKKLKEMYRSIIESVCSK